MKRFLTCLLLIFLLVFVLFTPNVQAVVTDRPFLIGWYSSIWSDWQTPPRAPDSSVKLEGFAQNGMSLVLTYTYSENKAQEYLDEAQRLGMKVLIEIPRKFTGRARALNLNQIKSFVNSHKNHPALWGWYLADEPELSWDQSGQLVGNWGSPQTLKAIYNAIKETGDRHPVTILNWARARAEYKDTYDVLMNDWYPKDCKKCPNCETCHVTNEVERQACIQCAGCSNCYDKGEFSFMIRNSYGIWRAGIEHAKNNGKDGYIAVCWGQDYDRYESYHKGDRKPGMRYLTENEFRYHVYTAVVQGVNGILFWQEPWADQYVKDLVYGIIDEIQSIGRQMNNGKTRGEVGDLISASISADDLVYRYGVEGNRQIILAVNIDGNENNSNVDPATVGQAFNNVQFTLPAGIRPSSVTVVGESRTLPVSNGVFADNFERYEVHIYEFTASSGPTPPSLRQIILRYGSSDSATDIRVDGLVNGLDFATAH